MATVTNLRTPDNPTVHYARLYDSLDVTDCNRNGSGLQSAHVQDHILCIYLRPQDRITCD